MIEPFKEEYQVILSIVSVSSADLSILELSHVLDLCVHDCQLGSRKEKARAVQKVLQKWRDQQPRGRFLARKISYAMKVCNRSGGKHTSKYIWYEVTAGEARKRASKSLADTVRRVQKIQEKLSHLEESMPTSIANYGDNSWDPNSRSLSPLSIGK